MPPKSKTNFSKTASSKKEILPPKLGNTNTGTSSGLSQEAENQFELELCWCIQQLEMSLANGKVQGKQAQDLCKSINVLKSNTAPLVKKRQTMRNNLSNYREKMAQEEQKFSKIVSSVKFTTTSLPNKKSVFLRKAVDQSCRKKENCEELPFLFNIKDSSVNSN